MEIQVSASGFPVGVHHKGILPVGIEQHHGIRNGHIDNRPIQIRTVAIEPVGRHAVPDGVLDKPFFTKIHIIGFHDFRIPDFIHVGVERKTHVSPVHGLHKALPGGPSAGHSPRERQQHTRRILQPVPLQSHQLKTRLVTV